MTGQNAENKYLYSTQPELGYLYDISYIQGSVTTEKERKRL